jgi:hypothetical protein
MDGRVKPGHDGSVFGTVPALRSGMKNAAPRPGHATSTASYAGLTRVSIDLHKSIFRSAMDCRVKPGNDAELYSAACCATVGAVPATVARRMSRGCDWS